MKITALFLILFLVAVAIARGGPKMSPVASISIRDSKFAVVRAIQEPSDIDTLLSCLRRAKRCGVSGDWQAFPYKIDVDRRWLYDPDRGEFMLLSKTEQPVYRLSEADRDSVNAFVVPKEKNDAFSPEPNQSSRPIPLKRPD